MEALHAKVRTVAHATNLPAPNDIAASNVDGLVNYLISALTAKGLDEPKDLRVMRIIHKHETEPSSFSPGDVEQISAWLASQDGLDFHEMMYRRTY